MLIHRQKTILKKSLINTRNVYWYQIYCEFLTKLTIDFELNCDWFLTIISLHFYSAVSTVILGLLQASSKIYRLWQQNVLCIHGMHLFSQIIMFTFQLAFLDDIIMFMY